MYKAPSSELGINFVDAVLPRDEVEIVHEFIRLCNDFRRKQIMDHHGIYAGIDPKNHSVWNPAHFKQSVAEISTLMQVVRKTKCERGLEIGLYHGGTHYFFRRLMQEMYTIELEFGFIYFVAQMMQLTGMSSGSFFIHAKSEFTSTVDRLAEILNGKLCDILFIDGNHRYSSCKSDYTLYEKFIRPGGIVAFHDFFTHEGVQRFVCELRDAGKNITCISCPSPPTFGIAYFEK